MPKGRRHKSQGEKETDLLQSPRWSGLREQRRLQAMNHSQAENDLARRQCREFVEGGWGVLPDLVKWVEGERW